MSVTGYIRLFKNHGTSVGFWEAYTELEVPSVEDDPAFSDRHGNSAKVVIRYARKTDGKVTRKEYWVKPKNRGRSNETTALEQGKLEIQSRVSKQLDKGYVHSAEEAKAPSRNTLGLTKPMLAQPLEKVKPEKIDWENSVSSAKLDGHRMLYKDGTLYSRQGKEIHLPHILSAIKDAGLENLHLDGEVYLHGKTLQEISSLVKRPREESEELVYHVYDTVSDLPYLERISIICNESIPLYQWQAPVQLLCFYRVKDMGELKRHHEVNLLEGYEGTMLRHGLKGYEDGKRSQSLCKLKEMSDLEVLIVGVEQGKSYFTEAGEFCVPVWVLETDDGKEFTATAQGDMIQKNYLWFTRDEHIGKQLTIQYFGFSKDGVPLLPVALRFREDI